MATKRSRLLTSKRAVVAASDCTGINGGALALESLGLQYEEAWASEADPATRRVLAASFSPRKIYPDIRDWDGGSGAGDIDFFSAGSPCQSFSRAGRRQGLDCENGKTLLHVLMRIYKVRPRTFLLENVDEMLKHEDTMDLILNFLKGIKD